MRYWRCPKCGWPGFDIPIRWQELPIHHECHANGMGDRVAAILAAVGVHKRRKCGCKRRQRWLNRALRLPKAVSRPNRWVQWMQTRRQSTAD